MGGYRSIVQFDKRPIQRETNSRSAVRIIEPTAGLNE